jgi:integrase
VAGRDSKRIQRGGFASEHDAAEALERELERLRRERRVSRSLTVAELVEVYLAQHDVEPVTIEKLRWLLGKAVAVFGERPVANLCSEEIAAWRIALSPSRYRPIVIFATVTGLRPAEWLALEWRDLDLKARVVYVHRSFTKGRLKCPKTEASRRAVPLQTIALDAIKQQLASMQSYLRPLPLHGRQADHDRLPLGPPRPRRTRTRDPPARRAQHE